MMQRGNQSARLVTGNGERLVKINFVESFLQAVLPVGKSNVFFTGQVGSIASALLRFFND
jgi:hypothetical protein